MQLTYKVISDLAENLRKNAYDLTVKYKPVIAYKISDNIDKLLLASVPVNKELKDAFDDHPEGTDLYFEYEEYAASHTREVDIRTFSADELGESISLELMELLRIMIEEPTE